MTRKQLYIFIAIISSLIFTINVKADTSLPYIDFNYDYIEDSGLLHDDTYLDIINYIRDNYSDYNIYVGLRYSEYGSRNYIYDMYISPDDNIANNIGYFSSNDGIYISPIYDRADSAICGFRYNGYANSIDTCVNNFNSGTGLMSMNPLAVYTTQISNNIISYPIRNTNIPLYATYDIYLHTYYRNNLQPHTHNFKIGENIIEENKRFIPYYDYLYYNLDINVSEDNKYMTTYNEQDFMLAIQNDICNEPDRYVDYRILINAPNSVLTTFSNVYMMSMRANNGFNMYIDNGWVNPNFELKLIDESNAQLDIRLAISDDLMCTTGSIELLKIDFDILGELQVDNYTIEILSSSANNTYTLAPQPFYDKDIYIINNGIYNHDNIFFYIDNSAELENSDNYIYLTNNVDFGAWNFQNTTSNREKYFNLEMKNGFYAYKMTFDTENSLITGFKAYSDNLIFIDTEYRVKSHSGKYDFEIGDTVIKDNTVNSAIIKDNYDNVGDLTDTFSSFMDRIRSTVAQYMGLFGDFFNSLNYYIKSAIITLFIILVMCAIIRLLFK